MGSLFWCFTTPVTEQFHPRPYKRFGNQQVTHWRNTENASYSGRSLSVYPPSQSLCGGGGNPKSRSICWKTLLACVISGKAAVDSIGPAVIPRCSLTFKVVPHSAGLFEALTALFFQFSSWQFIFLPTSSCHHTKEYLQLSKPCAQAFFQKTVHGMCILTEKRDREM